MYKVFLVPSKSLFPQSCRSSVIKSHWPSKANSLGVLSPLPDPQVGKSVVGPRTFATVQELLWYNYSPFCGLSAGWLYGEAHMPWLPGLLQPEPCPHSRPLLTCASIGDTQTLRGRSGSVSCGIPGSWCTQGFICALWASLVGVVFDLNTILLPPPHHLVWASPLPLGIGYFFFLVGSNILLSMVVQLLVAVLAFSQERISTHPSPGPTDPTGLEI